MSLPQQTKSLCFMELRLRLARRARDCVRHVARSEPKFTIKACCNRAGFTNDPPFWESVPFNNCTRCSPKPDATANEVICVDAGKNTGAGLACGLSNTKSSRALAPPNDRENNCINGQAYCNNGQFNDVSDHCC